MIVKVLRPLASFPDSKDHVPSVAQLFVTVLTGVVVRIRLTPLSHMPDIVREPASFVLKLTPLFGAVILIVGVLLPPFKLWLTAPQDEINKIDVK
jgi:hypothetical protein